LIDTLTEKANPAVAEALEYNLHLNAPEFAAVIADKLQEFESTPLLRTAYPQWVSTVLS